MSKDDSPSAEAPPAQPQLPTVAPGMGRNVARALSAAVIVTYLFLSFTGWSGSGGGTARGNVPTSVRSSPGGFRTYHFWHSGYMGGK